MSRNKTESRIAPLWQKAFPFLPAAGLFAVTCLASDSRVKVLCLLLLALALVAVVKFFPRVRDRFRAPVIALALVVCMDFISGFYAVAGKFALYGILRVVISFCVVLLMLALAQGEGEEPGRRAATVMEGCTVLMGLVSIDLISTRLLSGLVLGILGLFTPDYSSIAYDGLEVGVRMFAMFSNPNIFAGCAGIGVLLSLGLAVSSEKRARLFHLSCLYINSLAFLLSFSMGASATIALAFLAYIVFEEQERRSALLTLMVETLVLTAISVALISMTSFTKWSGPRPVPLLCAVLGAAALCAVDSYLGQSAARVLARFGKGVLLLTAGLVAALVVFVLLAWNLTGGITLQDGETLSRAAYPSPGSYTLTVQADAPVSVKITSQNQRDAMMHTRSVLYDGPLSGASFQVPEDSMVVYFAFSAQGTVRLEEAGYQGAESGSIPLGYKLLPSFMANRIQGLFANQNAIQRLVFFVDGLKLFQRSPVFGLGMGAYENGIRSVQSFDYVTKYAHNHYIQAMVETGVVGLILFVGLFVVSALALFRARKAEKPHPLLPALGAALVFMAGHAAVEVVFSAYPYLPLAFGVVALIALCGGPAEAREKKQVKTRALLASCALLVVFGVLLLGNMRAKSISQRLSSLTDLEQAIMLDKYEWADYMLSYVVSSIAQDVDAATRRKADQYAERMSVIDSNTIPLYLAEYYLNTGWTQKGMDMLEKYVDYVASDPETWNDVFSLLEYYDADTEIYQAGVAHIYQLLQDWSAANMGEIILSESAEAYIARKLE